MVLLLICLPYWYLFVSTVLPSFWCLVTQSHTSHCNRIQCNHCWYNITWLLFGYYFGNLLVIRCYSVLLLLYYCTVTTLLESCYRKLPQLLSTSYSLCKTTTWYHVNMLCCDTGSKRKYSGITIPLVFIYRYAWQHIPMIPKCRIMQQNFSNVCTVYK